MTQDPSKGVLAGQLAQCAALYQAGQYAAAEAVARPLTSHAASAPDAWHMLALIGVATRRPGMARESFEKALALVPTEIWWLTNYAQFLSPIDPQRTMEIARQILEKDPNSAAALNLLGWQLACSGQVEEGQRLLEKAVASDPGKSSAHVNLGAVYLAQLRLDDALACFDRALAITPGMGNARATQAETLLLRGDYERGWPAYVARWSSPDMPPKRHQHIPEWRGGDLRGKKLLLWAEQGVGDTFQAVRYCKLARERGAEVVLEVWPSVKSLLVRYEHAAAVRAVGESLPQVDLQAPLMDCPMLFGTRVETIPAEVPYLVAEPRAAARWRERLSGDKQLKVGLTWAGNPQHARDRERSIPLEKLVPLAGVKDVSFYALQLGPAARQIAEVGARFPLTDLGPKLTTWEETAAAVSALDLVVAVDTSVAHLAGALGRPTWTLVTYRPDWRWLLSRSDSPWYPTMRLFRQPARGAWDAVVEELVGALRERV